MVLDNLRGYECRYAVESETDEIYRLLEPLVCDDTQHVNIIDMLKRKLSKYLRYAIKTEQCVIVVKDGAITSAYAGDKDAIVYFGTKGIDLVSTTLLMHNVLNRLHNRFKESVFCVINDKQRNAWSKDTTTINEMGVGVVTLKAKELIECLYNALKEHQ